ncbi:MULTISPECIES: thiol:disulfide interchange protein DsbA/DsbL [unclassified Wenzhouxiangella]|uniref:thiol:disulfide interchange protein DsbA/DsbL n=1 Tax=unclassified Wenzhouxiangella TaxID=2613841 RepID=UPI000E32903F|nr:MULTISPECIES: thiol:disulfide interchange protein DsbA/DsbL [unclassified Wenzhouxiangella]RFF27074.1 thiol:disulfide interchange protein DsbA/DsbL [Wenzhouxiangella sp. 15181]RFP67180.1 thiol:disulfide interchange protein DsbA/DsbL [Wenzhouxiangella sp. 15190]
MRKFLIVMAGAALLGSGSLLAQDFQEGEHFQPVGNPVSMPDDRIVVTDGFGYPCPACRRFMPYLEAWEDDLPDYVEVKHLPVALQPGWDMFARAYYTAEIMGIAEETHEAMFKALHDERRQFRSFEDIAGFYAEHGVEADSFINTSESFAVDARIRQNRNDVRTYGIRGTPSVIVQGKWRVSPNDVSSYDEMLSVVDYLIEREAEALGLGGDAEAGESGKTATSEQTDDATS